MPSPCTCRSSELFAMSSSSSAIGSVLSNLPKKIFRSSRAVSVIFLIRPFLEMNIIPHFLRTNVFWRTWILPFVMGSDE